MGGSTGHSCNSQVVTDYEDVRQLIENNADGLNMVYQNTHVIGGEDSLFYSPVTIGECNEVSRYGKKEAGTGEHLTL